MSIYKSLNQQYHLPRIILAVAVLLVIIGLSLFFVFRRSTYHTYIALGDSVASGYGLPETEDGTQDRYTTLFFKKLSKDGYVNEYHNMAVNGFTTTMLLEKLNTLHHKDKRVFRDARIITINIGGNNVLVPFLDYLSRHQFTAGVDNVKSGTGRMIAGSSDVVTEVATGIKSAVSDSEETQFDIGNVTSGLKEIASGIGNFFVGIKDMIGGTSDLVDTWQGELSPELVSMLAEGVETFRKEFVEIIELTEKLSPDATIIVNTIFNPIPTEILALSVPLSKWADEMILAMNTTILDEGDKRHFLVVDVYNNFQGRTDLISFDIRPFAQNYSLDPVHPNARGHKLISDLNYETFLNSKQENK